MKLKKEFILREVAGETIVVPVGSMALNFNGIISLDPVGTVIWKALEQGKEREEILNEILENFEVEKEIAEADMDEFLKQLQDNHFME